MSASENPLGLCPTCLEKLRPVLKEVVDALRRVDEGLIRLEKARSAEW